MYSAEITFLDGTTRTALLKGDGNDIHDACLVLRTSVGGYLLVPMHAIQSVELQPLEGDTP